MNYINLWAQALKVVYNYFNFLSGCEEREVEVRSIGQQERRFARCSCPPGGRGRRGDQRGLEGADWSEREDQAKFVYAVV